MHQCTQKEVRVQPRAPSYLHAGWACVGVKVLFDWLACLHWLCAWKPASETGIKASRSRRSTSNRTRSQYKTVDDLRALSRITQHPNSRRDLSQSLDLSCCVCDSSQCAYQDVYGKGKVNGEERWQRWSVCQWQK